MKKMAPKIKKLLSAAFLLAMICSPKVLAVYSSSNYSANEVQFGIGGGLQSSPNYQAQSSVGDLGVGNATSSNYQIEGGFNTTAAPFLEAYVAGGTIDLGSLSTIAAAHTTATFHVRDYLSSGYIVQTVGKPPTYGSHTIAPMTSGGTSSAGTEQFGMNLVANTSPANFGANPAQNPDASFGFGYAAPGYATVNNYKYNQGDVIAKSDKSSGETDYTVSYIMNISNQTPGGTYVYNQDFVVTATY